MMLGTLRIQFCVQMMPFLTVYQETPQSHVDKGSTNLVAPWGFHRQRAPSPLHQELLSLAVVDGSFELSVSL